MAELSDFGKLERKYAGLIDFAIIYVEEAHPLDGWKFKVRTISSYYIIFFISSDDIYFKP